MCFNSKNLLLFLFLFTFQGSSRFERHYRRSWRERGKGKMMMVIIKINTHTCLSFGPFQNIFLSSTTSHFISYWVFCRSLVRFLHFCFKRRWQKWVIHMTLVIYCVSSVIEGRQEQAGCCISYLVIVSSWLWRSTWGAGQRRRRVEKVGKAECLARRRRRCQWWRGQGRHCLAEWITNVKTAQTWKFMMSSEIFFLLCVCVLHE